MEYLRKLFLSLKEIFAMMILQYVILFVCFLIVGKESSIIFGSILIIIFELSYIVWKFIKNNIGNGISKKIIDIWSYFPYILLGIGISTSYNMIIFGLGLGQGVNTEFPLILNILCSGIIGPIFEEFLFRYDFIKRLEKFNSSKIVIILLTGITFGLFHTGIVTIIYAMIVGFINSYIYVKDKDIIKPITLHMAGNIFVNFLTGYNIVTLILGFILIIIFYCIIRHGNYSI